jgi:hypothetical protein
MFGAYWRLKICALVGFCFVSTCFHTHMRAFCAWVHVGGVDKNQYPTPKQAKKNKANTKSNPTPKQSCGTAKTEVLT